MSEFEIEALVDNVPHGWNGLRLIREIKNLNLGFKIRHTQISGGYHSENDSRKYFYVKIKPNDFSVLKRVRWESEGYQISVRESDKAIQNPQREIRSRTPRRETTQHVFYYWII